MSSTVIHASRYYSRHRSTSTPALGRSFLAAHLTALFIIGTLYFLGLFDVGFLSSQSLAVQLVHSLASMGM